MNNFLLRTITGILFVVVVIGSLLLDEIGFALLFLTIMFSAQREFYNLLETKGYVTFKIFGVALGLILFVLLFLEASYDIEVKYGLIVALYLIIPVALIFDKSGAQPVMRFAGTILGIVYVSLPLTLSIWLAYINGVYNAGLLIGVFVLLWANDTFAYLSGVSFGKTKFFERISPKKTWEGFIGGSIATIVLSVFLKNWIPFDLAVVDWMIIAVLVVVAGNFGDLTESVMKRSLQVKDSGRAFPGHGGVLDRFDSILLALPAVFAYLYIFKY